MRTIEQIDVIHETGNETEDDVNYKTFSHSFNGLRVDVDMHGPNHYAKGVFIQISSEDEDGFWIKVKKINGKLHLSIDHGGGMTQTVYRTYREWIKLEQLERSIQLIGSILK